MGEQSSQSDDRVSVNEHFAKNLRSLSEGEKKQKLKLARTRLLIFLVDRVVVVELHMCYVSLDVNGST